MASVTIEQLVEKAGSQSDFARRIGTSQQLVSYWLSKGKSILPAEFVLAAEREFDVSRHDIRPDIYPLEAKAPRVAMCGACGKGVNDPTIRSCTDTGCPLVNREGDEPSADFEIDQGGTADRGQGAGSSPLSTSQPAAAGAATAAHKPAGTRTPSRKAA